MTNIIITSEQRVGSRWVHYLLRDLLDMRVSPEIDVKDIPNCQKRVNDGFKNKEIIKFHHAKLEDVLRLKGSYKIIGIVRNPRDRIVSYAFHQRYKPPGQGIEEIKKAKSDKEAVKICSQLQIVFKHNEDQFNLMGRELSTKRYVPGRDQTYIWSCYHWLKEDLVGEITKIVAFLGVDVPKDKIKQVCRQHEFEERSGRIPGIEERRNEWFRKGVEDDYKKWFDEEMLQQTAFFHHLYWKIIEAEENGRN